VRGRRVVGYSAVGRVGKTRACGWRRRRRQEAKTNLRFRTLQIVTFCDAAGGGVGTKERSNQPSRGTDAVPTSSAPANVIGHRPRPAASRGRGEEA
jgi:hypothetical protein